VTKPAEVSGPSGTPRSRLGRSRFGGLLVVGLAPGLKGANRTGRPFTGDYAGDLLYATLLKFGLATGTSTRPTGRRPHAAQRAIANAVRCVPPENKPTPPRSGPAGSFWSRTARQRPPRAYLALGRIAHDSLLTALGERPRSSPSPMAPSTRLAGGAVLFDSYHCSRYNTNTGVLTTAMFEDVVGRAARLVSR
jgi:uracil-DNA glycosylase family 4